MIDMHLHQTKDGQPVEHAHDLWWIEHVHPDDGHGELLPFGPWIKP